MRCKFPPFSMMSCACPRRNSCNVYNFESRQPARPSLLLSSERAKHGEMLLNGPCPLPAIAWSEGPKTCTGHIWRGLLHVQSLRIIEPSGRFVRRASNRIISLSTTAIAECVPCTKGFDGSPPAIIGRLSEGTRTMKLYPVTYLIAAAASSSLFRSW